MEANDWRIVADYLRMAWATALVRGAGRDPIVRPIHEAMVQAERNAYGPPASEALPATMPWGPTFERGES